MTDLERRLIFRLLRGDSFSAVLPVLEEIKARSRGDRLATMLRLRDVELSPAEKQTQTSRETR